MKSNLPEFLTKPWFLIVIALAVAVLGFVTINQTSTPDKTTSTTTTSTPTSSTLQTSDNANMATAADSHVNANPATSPNLAVNQPSTPAAPEKLEKWEEDLDAALDDNLSDEQSVEKILSLYPTFPEDGKIEAVEYLVDLVEDKDYSKVEPLLYDAKAPEEVLETLMDDLYGREEYVQLPAMLKIMQNPSHPLYEDAKENLADYLEEDYGNDMGKWEAGVKKYLEENPPEPEEDGGETEE